MKIAIRQNTFETNSSSAHAIMIDTRNGYKDHYKEFYTDRGVNQDKDKEPHVYSGDHVTLGYYGRPMKVEVYSTESERLSYLWTAISEICLDTRSKKNYEKEKEFMYDWKGWEEKIRKAGNIPDYIYFERLKGDPYFDESKFEQAFKYEYKPIKEWEKGYEYGVDHYHDLYPLLDELYNNESLLRDYILGKSSYVVVSSDEYDYESGFSTLSLWPYFSSVQNSYYELFDEYYEARQDESKSKEEIHELYEKAHGMKQEVRAKANSFEDGKVHLFLKFGG